MLAHGAKKPIEMRGKLDATETAGKKIEPGQSGKAVGRDLDALTRQELWDLDRDMATSVRVLDAPNWIPLPHIVDHFPTERACGLELSVVIALIVQELEYQPVLAFSAWSKS